jgi:transposase
MGAGRTAVAEQQRPRELRWSARRKAEVVLRLLRGEDLDELSREMRVEAHRLAAWRDEFLAGGMEGLKAGPASPEERRLKEAERKIGELTMEVEILRAAARKGGLQTPSRSGLGERPERGGPGRRGSGPLGSLPDRVLPGGHNPRRTPNPQEGAGRERRSPTPTSPRRSGRWSPPRRSRTRATVRSPAV